METKTTDPSVKAVEAARKVLVEIPGVDLSDYAESLAGAVSDAVLRDVVEALRDSSIAEGVDSPFGAADFLEREFATPHQP